MRLALVLTAALLFFAEPAYGFAPLNAAPASQVYGDALLRSAIADADGWWMGVAGRRPPPVALFVFDARGRSAGAYGAMPGNSVWISRGVRNDYWAVANDRSWSLRQRRNALSELWWIAAHERGHNLGLGHSAVCPNVMCKSAARSRPARAGAWARQMLPATNIDLAGKSR